MAELRIAHTAHCRPEELRAVRQLLYDVFDDMTEDDYEHGLGGMHAMVWQDGQLLAHGSVVLRRLLHGGRALRTGYVEAVAVRADHRGQGHGAAVMTALEQLVRGAYELGALGATDEAREFYAARGWQQWPGTASVVTPDGSRPTEQDEGGIYVLPVSVELAPYGDLACDWRDGDVW